MLCYRGVQYLPKGHLFQTAPGKIIGKYRGAEVRSRCLITPIYQPTYLLFYRGVPYFTHGSQIAESVEQKSVTDGQPEASLLPYS